MPQPLEGFECRLRPSRALLLCCLGLLALALLALFLADLPWWAQLFGVLLLGAQAAWVLPRQVLLSHKSAICALRHDARGFFLYSRQSGWQAVQLRADTLALPIAVVLRFRLPGQWFARGLCIPADALEREAHRKLRVRLKFARARFRVPAVA